MTELSCLPYSVGYEDEGVCLNIQIGPYSILLDCGLTDISELLQQPADFVFCSHAHTDHIRGLLPLHRAFPQLPIFSSVVTAKLLPLNWPQQEDTHFCRALPWRTETEIAPGLSVQLWPAGHLPGAACFLLTYQTAQRSYSVFYGGDCFLSNGRLVDGMPLSELRNLKPNVLIVEGSYGTERHPHRKQQENYLVERLGEALTNQGRAIFPAPLLGLGQELLMLLRSHHHFTGQPIDIWVDPLVAASCDAYLGCLSALPATVQNFAQHQPLFWDERVLPRVRRLGDLDRRNIEARDLEAGNHATAASDSAIFIVHPATHPSLYCQEDGSHWTVFAPDVADIALWQSQLDTRYHQFDWLGELDKILAPPPTKSDLPESDLPESELAESDLPEGNLPGSSALGSDSLRLEHYMLTNHCDGVGTTQLIHNLRPQHVIFVHGGVQQLTDLASLDDLQARYQLHLPTPAQTIELPLASDFWQPAPPGNLLYEGEVNAEPGGIQLRLPTSLESDPRWVQLADTGIVEASWQGDQLVIRGLSQKELMQVPPTKRMNVAAMNAAKNAATNADSGKALENASEKARGEVLGPPSTCYYCRHLRGQRCRNTDSPLVGLQVTSDGSCAVFERSGQYSG